MRLIIHDLDTEQFKKIFPSLSDDTIIVSDNGEIHHCIGCFGCWIKTPAACVIRDNYGDMGEYISKCNEMIIISKCCYGGFSPFVKIILDRSISYVHPYFVIRNNEMHHKKRYKHELNIQVYFYGENLTEKEKLTAGRLVKANSINLEASIGKVIFVRDIEEMEGIYDENSIN